MNRSRVAVAVAAMIALPTGCSAGQPAPSSAIQTGIPASVANVPQDRSAVSLSECTATDGGWRAGGTIKNPGASARTYTVTVFFTSKAATVLASQSTQVGVDPGQTQDWSVTAAFAAPEGTRCVLRGVAAS